MVGFIHIRELIVVEVNPLLFGALAFNDEVFFFRKPGLLLAAVLRLLKEVDLEIFSFLLREFPVFFEVFDKALDSLLLSKV